MFQHTQTHNNKNQTKQLGDRVGRLTDRFLVFEWYDPENGSRSICDCRCYKTSSPLLSFSLIPPSSSPSSSPEMPAINGVHANGVTAHPSEARPKDVGILAMEMYFPYRVRLQAPHVTP